jgi:hypothetical protein
VGTFDTLCLLKLRLFGAFDTPCQAQSIKKRDVFIKSRFFYLILLEN